MRRDGWLIGLVLVCGCVAAASGQGFPADQAAAKMQLPPRFRAELVAAEPLVRQPVAIDFDDRGRLWVIQYLQYPNPAGLARVQVDRFSRTRYDKVPDPPPHGPRGEDRLTILEADPEVPGKLRAKDFVSGLNLASGFAFGHGGVFVLNPPYLLFYPDRDQNDEPDSDPEVLLTGFGMDDAHSVANSLAWGPDGWLYGCQGSTVTANIRGIEFQQGVWRYHPLRKEFELFCEGGGNSWGLDFDRHGNLLYSTNHGGFVMLHGVQGAYLWKQFGKHGELHNPHAYGYFDHVPHEGFRGGHVTVGGIVYRGGTFPASFDGKYIAGDLLGHGVNWHHIEPRGTTFRTQHGGELLVANDTWFATSDVCLGPDGCVYVADWHDARTAHPDPDATWDRSNGRIYRIVFGEPPATPAFDLHQLTSQELLKQLSHKNHWYAVRARRILAERRDSAVVQPLLAQVRDSKDDEPALEALWALYGSGGFTEEFGRQLVTHASPHVRAWSVRFLGDQKRVRPETAQLLTRLAETDGSPLVRSQLACSARRLPAADGVPILMRLMTRNLDDADAYLPLLLWWGVETHALDSRQELVTFLADRSRSRLPLVGKEILPRLMRRYVAEGAAETDDAARSLLAEATAESLPALLTAVEQGIQARPAGQRLPYEPLRQWLADQRKKRPDDLVLLRILVRAREESAIAAARFLVADPKAAAADRISVLGVLPQAGKAGLAAELTPLLGSSEPEGVRLAALAALAQLGSDETPAAFLAEYLKMTDRLQAAARAALLGRRKWAAAALAAVDVGRLPAKDFAPDELRLVAAHGDRGLDDLVRKHWGTIGLGTPEEKLAEVRRLNNDLRAATGDPKVGRTLFTKHCANCHKLFSDGNAVGPDLTHANRTDRDYLLVSLVDPSSVIRKEFLTYQARLDDGRVVSGLIAEQNAEQVTFFNAKAEKIVVLRSSIQELRESTVSLMPDNLHREFQPQELRDLFAYLQRASP